MKKRGKKSFLTQQKLEKQKKQTILKPFEYLKDILRTFENKQSFKAMTLVPFNMFGPYFIQLDIKTCP